MSRTVWASTALAAASSAGTREMLQRGMNARKAWEVASETCAAPPAPAGAGRQSRNGVAATNGSVAKRKIGFPEESGPAGDVTLITTAAIAFVSEGRQGPRLRSLSIVSLFTTNDAKDHPATEHWGPMEPTNSRGFLKCVVRGGPVGTHGTVRWLQQPGARPRRSRARCKVAQL